MIDSKVSDKKWRIMRSLQEKMFGPRGTSLFFFLFLFRFENHLEVAADSTSSKQHVPPQSNVPNAGDSKLFFSRISSAENFRGRRKLKEDKKIKPGKLRKFKFVEEDVERDSSNLKQKGEKDTSDKGGDKNIGEIKLFQPSISPTSVPTGVMPLTQLISPSIEPSISSKTSSESASQPPSHYPSKTLSYHPSKNLSHHPSKTSSFEPSANISDQPSIIHSNEPSHHQSNSPSLKMSYQPSLDRSHAPSWGLKSSEDSGLTQSIPPTRSPISLPSTESTTPAPRKGEFKAWDTPSFRIYISLLSTTSVYGELDDISFEKVIISHMSRVFGKNLFFHSLELEVFRMNHRQLTDRLEVAPSESRTFPHGRTYGFHVSGKAWFISSYVRNMINDEESNQPLNEYLLELTEDSFDSTNTGVFVESLRYAGIDVVGVTVDIPGSIKFKNTINEAKKGSTASIDSKVPIIFGVVVCLVGLVSVMIYRRTTTEIDLKFAETKRIQGLKSRDVYIDCSYDSGESDLSFSIANVYTKSNSGIFRKKRHGSDDSPKNIIEINSFTASEITCSEIGSYSDSTMSRSDHHYRRKEQRYLSESKGVSSSFDSRSWAQKLMSTMSFQNNVFHKYNEGAWYTEETENAGHVHPTPNADEMLATQASDPKMKIPEGRGHTVRRVGIVRSSPIESSDALVIDHLDVTISDKAVVASSSSNTSIKCQHTFSSNENEI